MSDELASKLKRELDVTSWRDLRAHAARDNLFVVDGTLSLVEVGQAVAKDQAAQVQGWISGGLITRPTREQMQVWEHNLEQAFRCLIVSPFVLVQLPEASSQLH